MGLSLALAASLGKIRLWVMTAGLGSHPPSKGSEKKNNLPGDFSNSKLEFLVADPESFLAQETRNVIWFV